jgi:hypothetical protein
MIFYVDFSQRKEQNWDAKNTEIFQPSSSSCIGEIIHDFSAGICDIVAGNCMVLQGFNCKNL